MDLGYFPYMRERQITVPIDNGVSVVDKYMVRDIHIHWGTHVVLTNPLRSYRFTDTSVFETGVPSGNQS